MLTITKIKIYPYKKVLKNGVVGIAQVTIENGILLTGLELVERNNKRFILFPKNPNNKHDLCYCQPTNSTINKLISDSVFKEYDELKLNEENNSCNSEFETSDKDLEK